VDGLSMHIAEGAPPVLYVAGELDLATAPHFVDAVDRALAVDSKLVIDLADVTFIDASGLHAILRTAQSGRAKQPLTLLNASRVAWLLKVVGLEGLPVLAMCDGPVGHVG
jgi:anti-anti-sigma factor